MLTMLGAKPKAIRAAPFGAPKHFEDSAMAVRQTTPR